VHGCVQSVILTYVTKPLVISCVAIQSIQRIGTDLSPSSSVGLSDRWVNYGKTARWIWMPFGMVNGVGRGMGVLDGVEIVEGEGAVLWINAEHPIVTNGDFVAKLLSE